MFPRLALFVLALALVSFERPALADEKTELAAESSFADGMRHMKADHWEEAVKSFRESQRLDPASGTALNIGYCEARLGRVASAWLAYRQALRLAQAQGKAQHESVAREQADKLEPTVPHLTVVLGRDQPAGVGLRLDGALLEREMWSVPMPVDSGAHRVETVVDGKVTFKKEVTLANSERQTLEVPPPAAAAGTRLGPMLPVARTPARPAPEPADRAPEGGSSQRTWGYILGGVGAATFVTGAALFVSARVEYDGAADDCKNGCNDAGFAARDSARSRAFLSYGVAGAGAVIGGIGLTLALTAGDGPGAAEKSALVVGSPKAPLSVAWRAKF